MLHFPKGSQNGIVNILGFAAFSNKTNDFAKIWPKHSLFCCTIEYIRILILVSDISTLFLVNQIFVFLKI